MVVDVDRAALGSLDAADVSCLAGVRVVSGSTGDGGGFAGVGVADCCLLANGCRTSARVVGCSARAVSVIAVIDIFHTTALPNGACAGGGIISATILRGPGVTGPWFVASRAMAHTGPRSVVMIS